MVTVEVAKPHYAAPSYSSSLPLARSLPHLSLLLRYPGCLRSKAGIIESLLAPATLRYNRPVIRFDRTPCLFLFSLVALYSAHPMDRGRCTSPIPQVFHIPRKMRKRGNIHIHCRFRTIPPLLSLSFGASRRSHHLIDASREAYRLFPPLAPSSPSSPRD